MHVLCWQFNCQSAETAPVAAYQTDILYLWHQQVMKYWSIEADVSVQTNRLTWSRVTTCCWCCSLDGLSLLCLQHHRHYCLNMLLQWYTDVCQGHLHVTTVSTCYFSVTLTYVRATCMSLLYQHVTSVIHWHMSGPPAECNITSNIYMQALCSPHSTEQLCV